MHIKTPLIRSKTLSKLSDKTVYLKLDNCQPSGSFKLRGVGLACERAVANGAKHLVASSGGNAGLAVAYTATELGVPATVFVPEPTPQYMVDRLQIEGAIVKKGGRVWAEAHSLALDYLSKTQSATYIHPFDHPDIFDGHATVVHELKDQLPSQPDLIVVSVGGGGYFAGICQGLKECGWESTKVLTMEPVGANGLEQSLKANKVVVLPQINTIAKSLAASSVAQTAFDYAKELNVFVKSCTDEEAVNACVHFANDHKYLVEPACGAALSVIYSGRLKEQLGDDFDNIKSICVMVCGGSMTRIDQDIRETLKSIF